MCRLIKFKFKLLWKWMLKVHFRREVLNFEDSGRLEAPGNSISGTGAHPESLSATRSPSFHSENWIFPFKKEKNDAGEKRLQWTISARTTLFWLWFSHDIDFLGKKGLFSHCFSGGNIDTGGQSATEPGATWCTCTCQWKGARNTCTTSKKTSQLLNLIIEQSQSIICVECLAKYLTESTTWRLVNAFTLRCQPSNVIKTPAAEFAIFSCFAVGRNLEDGHLPLEPDSTLFC